MHHLLFPACAGVSGKVTNCYKHEPSVPRTPAGLGTSIEVLKRMCRDDRTALDTLDKATVNPTGSNQHTLLVDNIHKRKTRESPTGTPQIPRCVASARTGLTCMLD